MRKGRFLILCLMWSLTLTLFTLSAVGAKNSQTLKNQSMTGDETGYHETESEENGEGEKIIRVNGCLPERDMAKRFEKKFEGIISGVTVKIGANTIAVYGEFCGDSDELIKKYPDLEPYSFVLNLAKGAPAEVKMRLTWEKDKGFSSKVEEVSLRNVDVPKKDMEKISKGIAKDLNSRGNGLDHFEITRWELLPGGLYYSALLPDEKSVELLYP